MWRRRADPQAGLAHEVFLDYIEKELRVERERKTQLDQRGVTLITSSASLVTLLFALSALVSGQKFFNLSLWTAVLLACTLTAFSISVLFGLMVTRLVTSEVGTPESLSELREKHWTASAASARAAVAKVHTATIAELRKGNKKKVELLQTGQTFQLLATVMLTASVLTILSSMF